MNSDTKKSILSKSLADTEKFKDASSKMLTIASTFKQWMEASKEFSVANKKIEVLKARLSSVDLVRFCDRDETLDATLRIRDLNLPLVWMEDCKKKFPGSFHYYFTLETDENVIASEICEADTSTILMQAPEVTLDYVSLKSMLKINLFYIVQNPTLHSKVPCKLKSAQAENLCLNFTRFASAKVNLSDFKKDTGPAKPLTFDLVQVNEIVNIKQQQKTPVNSSMNKSQTQVLYNVLLDPWKFGLANFYVQPSNVDACKKVVGKFVTNDGKKATCMVVEGDQLIFYETVNTSITLPSFSLQMLFCTVKDAVTPDKNTVKCQVIDTNTNKEFVLIFFNMEEYMNLKSSVETYKKFVQNWGVRVILPSQVKTPSEIFKVTHGNQKLLINQLFRE